MSFSLRQFIKLLLVSLLLLAMPISHSLAMMGIRPVSKDLAKEMGIELRFTDNGPSEVSVQLTFKAEGKLKDFSHVSLEIREGEKFLLGYTALREKRESDGRMTITSLVNREFLNKVTLRIVAGEPGNQGGFELHLGDFLK